MASSSHTDDASSLGFGCAGAMGGVVGMRAMRIAVEGAASPVGRRLVQQLEGEPQVESVDCFGGALDSPRARRRLRSCDVLLVLSPCQHQGLTQRRALTPRAVRELRRLLGSVAFAPRLRRVVVASTTLVYPGIAQAPSVWREDDLVAVPGRPPAPPVGVGRIRRLDPHWVQAWRAGGGGRALGIEAAALAAARPEDGRSVAVLRLAPLAAGGVGRCVASRLGAVAPAPALALWNPRFQLLHPDDALDVLAAVVLGEQVGTWNIASSEVLTFLQARGRFRAAVRRRKRPQAQSGAARRLVLPDLRQPEAWLRPSARDWTPDGQVVDLDAVRRDLGWTPRWRTTEILEELSDHRLGRDDFQGEGDGVPLVVGVPAGGTKR